MRARQFGLLAAIAVTLLLTPPAHAAAPGTCSAGTNWDVSQRSCPR